MVGGYGLSPLHHAHLDRNAPKCHEYRLGEDSVVRLADGVHQALVLDGFLETSRSQLTVYGISELHRLRDEGSCCVFFRNNHFSVLHKHTASRHPWAELVEHKAVGFPESTGLFLWGRLWRSLKQVWEKILRNIVSLARAFVGCWIEQQQQLVRRF